MGFFALFLTFVYYLSQLDTLEADDSNLIKTKSQITVKASKGSDLSKEHEGLGK